MKALKILTKNVSSRTETYLKLWGNSYLTRLKYWDESPLDDTLIHLIRVNNEYKDQIKFDAEFHLAGTDNLNSFEETQDRKTDIFKNRLSETRKEFLKIVKRLSLNKKVSFSVHEKECLSNQKALELYNILLEDQSNEKKIKLKKVTCFDLKLSGSSDLNDFVHTVAKFHYYQSLLDALDGVSIDRKENENFNEKPVIKNLPQLIRLILDEPGDKVWTTKELREEIGDKYILSEKYKKSLSLDNTINKAIARVSKEYPSIIAKNSNMAR